MTTTFDGLRAIIVRDFELPADQLRRDTALEEIELDSLAITELVFALEDEFHVTAGNVNPAFKNLGDIADYIDTLIAERDAAPKAASGTAKPGRAAVTKPVRAPAEKSAGPRAAKSARAKPTAAARSPGAKAARGAGSRTKAAGARRGAVNGSAHANGGKPAAPAPGDARPRKGKRSSATASGVRTR